MRIKNIRILIAVVIFVLAIMMFKFGLVIWPFVGFAIIISPVIYLFILAKRYVDAKVQESKASTNLNDLRESIDRIEKKLDKIDKILEKVSE